MRRNESGEYHQKSRLGSATGPEGLPIRMGKPAAFARNLRLLAALHDLTAEGLCRELKQMLVRKEANLRAAILEEDLGSVRRRDTDAELNAVAVAVKRINAKWIRRLMSKGVSRSDKRTRTQFHAIAKFFRVEYALLWEETLITVQHPGLGQPLATPYAPFAVESQKLVELLELGDRRYGYLSQLIDSLHREAFSMPASAGKYTSSGFYMPDVEDDK